MQFIDDFNSFWTTVGLLADRLISGFWSLIDLFDKEISIINVNIRFTR